MTEATAAALPQLETGAASGIQRQIRPLGDQIIIRVLPPSSVGSIIIPDSAKRISYGGSAKATPAGDQLQYVNRMLFEQMTESLRMLCAGIPIDDSDWEFLKDLHKRADKALLPKVSKGIQAPSGEALNFVEAEVIAVGPGKRGKDRRVFDEMVRILEGWNAAADFDAATGFMLDLPIPVDKLLELAKRDARIPPLVKPGDRILYHPAVQSFDRKINPELLGLKPEEGDCYIIGEHSVLAVLERDE